MQLNSNRHVLLTIKGRNVFGMELIVLRKHVKMLPCLFLILSVLNLIQIV